MASVSNKAWSDFTEADFSLEQWHRACLIHLHSTRLPSSKDQCKLPVREPNGMLNRNAIFAAAAALAGARSPLKAPREEKIKAAKRIVSLYRNVLNESPPDSILALARSG